MDIKSILGDVLNVAGSVTGIGILKDAATALNGANIPPEQQEQIQEALMKHQEVMGQQRIDELKEFISESLAEINSSDKYTSRARPTGVYAATLITTILAVGMLWGVKLDTGAVATLLVPLWGSAAYYTYNRTQEKISNGNHQ